MRYLEYAGLCSDGVDAALSRLHYIVPSWYAPCQIASFLPPQVAGMSYLKYAGLCSDMVRAALLPELRAKARTREVVYYREAVWKEGQPEKQSAS